MKKLGIIAALPEELETVLRDLSGAAEKTVCGRTYYEAGAVVAALSGCGKVNAALCAQTMILAFGVDAVLNIGCAGGLREELKVGDLVVANLAAQHDLLVFERMGMECLCDPQMSVRLLRLAGPGAVSGPVVSGDHFVESAQEKALLSDGFSAAACDMEAGAIGLACRMAGVPFAVVRGISDGADEGARASFAECLKLASGRAAEVAVAFIREVVA